MADNKSDRHNTDVVVDDYIHKHFPIGSKFWYKSHDNKSRLYTVKSYEGSNVRCSFELDDKTFEAIWSCAYMYGSPNRFIPIVPVAENKELEKVATAIVDAAREQVKERITADQFKNAKKFSDNLIEMFTTGIGYDVTNSEERKECFTKIAEIMNKYYFPAVAPDIKAHVGFENRTLVTDIGVLEDIKTCRIFFVHKDFFNRNKEQKKSLVSKHDVKKIVNSVKPSKKKGKK